MTTASGTSDQPKRWSSAGMTSRAMKPADVKTMMIFCVSALLRRGSTTHATCEEGWICF